MLEAVSFTRVRIYYHAGDLHGKHAPAMHVPLRSATLASAPAPLVKMQPVVGEEQPWRTVPAESRVVDPARRRGQVASQIRRKLGLVARALLRP